MVQAGFKDQGTRDQIANICWIIKKARKFQKNIYFCFIDYAKAFEFQYMLFAYIPCSQRWRSSIQSTKTRPGADCGSDHELLIAKFRLILKKVGKTARPFRYDQNQIPYDYTVEVRNRFKGLDLIDRVPDELWNEVCDIVQETEIKTIPVEKKCKKAKWLSGEALQIDVKRREAKSKGEKER